MSQLEARRRQLQSQSQRAPSTSSDAHGAAHTDARVAADANANANANANVAARGDARHVSASSGAAGASSSYYSSSASSSRFQQVDDDPPAVGRLIEHLGATSSVPSVTPPSHHAPRNIQSPYRLRCAPPLPPVTRTALSPHSSSRVASILCRRWPKWFKLASFPRVPVALVSRLPLCRRAASADGAVVEPRFVAISSPWLTRPVGLQISATTDPKPVVHGEQRGDVSVEHESSTAHAAIESPATASHWPASG
ncbi:hypothetical protein TPAR_03434 [Tolypocladium paradoxum]|uniref:Uncharacterized protein n=1 Tax=Tolypocladium paradoxum TaxID=94208 RepID=A0A2S4L1Q9_9HYPO|nr:hypothetical protein TPAR_03434 [Tolypocladium paradoxum]